MHKIKMNPNTLQLYWQEGQHKQSELNLFYSSLQVSLWQKKKKKPTHQDISSTTLHRTEMQ